MPPKSTSKRPASLDIQESPTRRKSPRKTPNTGATTVRPPRGKPAREPSSRPIGTRQDTSDDAQEELRPSRSPNKSHAHSQIHKPTRPPILVNIPPLRVPKRQTQNSFAQNTEGAAINNNEDDDEDSSFDESDLADSDHDDEDEVASDVSQPSQTSRGGRLKLKEGQPKPRVLKKAAIDASLDATENISNSTDLRKMFTAKKLDNIYRLKSVTPLLISIREYFKLMEMENPTAFEDGEKITLVLPPGWRLSGDGANTSDRIDRDTKDVIWETVLRKGLKSQKQTASKELLEQVGLTDQNLQQQIKKHSGSDGETKDAGPSIPIKDYEVLMRMFFLLCRLRFSENFKNTWKANYGGITFKDQCHFNDPKDINKGTFYNTDWTWLKTCYVRHSKIFKAEEYENDGTPATHVKEYLAAQLGTMTRTDEMAEVFRVAFHTVFQSGRGTDRYVLPPFMKEQIETRARDRKAQQLLDLWKSDPSNATSLEQDDISEAMQAKNLLNTALKDRKEELLLRREINKIVREKSASINADWIDYDEESLVTSILRNFRESVGREMFIKVCHHVEPALKGVPDTMATGTQNWIETNQPVPDRDDFGFNEIENVGLHQDINQSSPLPSIGDDGFLDPFTAPAPVTNTIRDNQFPKPRVPPRTPTRKPPTIDPDVSIAALSQHASDLEDEED